jgi:Bacterial regulatory proteins, luxR family
VDGLSSRLIAGRLSISHRTVEKHVERLLAKTGARNRAHLGAIAALGVAVPVAEAEPDVPALVPLQGRVALRVVGRDRRRPA